MKISDIVWKFGIQILIVVRSIVASSTSEIVIDTDGTMIKDGGGSATALKHSIMLEGAQSMIDTIILDNNCHPFFVRLAWHDSGTYDIQLQNQSWPKAGGAIGSIRFTPEISHAANAGLYNAIQLLEPVKVAYPNMSYADIYQMASARSIELAGGPKIDMKYVFYYLLHIYVSPCDVG